MGRDKAELTVDGVELWRRQLAVLRETEPMQVMISAAREEGFAGSEAEIVADGWPECGPLGGIATALRSCEAPRLLVLAVDMPRMSAEYLRGLVDEAERTDRGVVPRDASGKWEPLAAVYPREAVWVAEAMLKAGRRKMEEFVLQLVEGGLVKGRNIREEERGLFENWNVPGDVVGEAE
jgi:molybdopterin-guanine dinucleotide biosynthesis protein A